MRLNTTDTTLDLSVTGGAGDLLDVRMKVSNKATEDEIDFIGTIKGNMPLGKLVFVKTDQGTPGGQDGPRTDGWAGNVVMRYDTPHEDTLFVRGTSLTNINVNLEKRVSGVKSGRFFYNGSTTEGLDIFLNDRDCAKMKFSASNLPSRIALRYKLNGYTQNYVNVSDQSAKIDSVTIAKRIGAECEQESGDGHELFVKATNLPSAWGAGLQLRPQGFIKIGTDDPDGRIGSLDAGLRLIQTPDRNIELHFVNVHIALEWNIAVIGDYAGDPYLYCHTNTDVVGGAALGSLRMQWGQFGWGIKPGAGGSLGCDKLMFRVRMDWTTVLYASVYIATSGALGAPPVERTGTLVFTTRNFVVEVFVAGHWWTVSFPGWS